MKRLERRIIEIHLYVFNIFYTIRVLIILLCIAYMSIQYFNEEQCNCFIFKIILIRIMNKIKIVQLLVLCIYF